ncbi:MAG TPA: hypothetical protein VL400_14770 [Polyangiaceae bacterium]|jgi:hypothetical protein|nr:hypothetical protein [Polyangiaceae bacterium]
MSPPMLVKGTSVRTILLAIERGFGAEGLARVKSVLPDDVRRQVDVPALASKTYPVEVSAALHDAIRSELGRGSLVANRKVGIEAARIDFGGVYSVFLRFRDYESLLRGLERAWLQYNSRGSVRWEDVAGDHTRGTIEGVDGFNEGMWHSIAGRLETILILAGAKKSSVLVDAWSPQHVAFTVRWTR